ncbi:unnamed protein product [Bursaphelenchus xylophilus]|uniref:(pine wood nematode) hypothetical protein n=1 Tax=Bursaphelenchus xylophilus TaxID=6326 RepID=A0A1I7SD30_BURXY|nr:unnamed protein product [Bursaphelenchus xylophilus]CAG9093031.1 unnamed protein product [Bursaphelenchus xylophilus]
MHLGLIYLLVIAKCTIGIELQILDGYFYTINVTIGSPPQVFTLALDITTSNTWVFGNSSELDLIGENKTYYDPRYSVTSLRVAPFQQNSSLSSNEQVSNLIKKYDTTIFADAMQLNHDNIGSIRFIVVENYDVGSYSYLPTNGLFGLGQDVLENGIGIISNILHFKKANTISLYTPRNVHNDKAYMLFGEASPHVNCKQTNWTLFDVYDNTNESSKLFEMKYTFSKFGTHKLQSPSYPYFALSTLTSYITVNTPMFKLISKTLTPFHDRNRTKPVHTVNCKWRNEAPPLEFGTKDFKFSIPPSDYIQETKPNYCVLKIRLNEANPRWVFGISFLKNYCVQFRLQDKKVGFIPSAEP